MAKIPDELVRQIKEANDIVEVIGEYIELKRTGSVYHGRCPFPHEGGKKDRYPSFTVNAEQQFFYCFGCGKGTRQDGNLGSDVIAFIREIENVPFEEACQILAERAGIKIEYSPEEEERYAELSRHKEKMTLRNKRFVRTLQQAEGPIKEKVDTYLTEHGIESNYTIGLGRLGLVPPDFGGSDPNPFQLMIRNRLVVGIPDISKTTRRPKTVALAYRTLDDDDSVPKWINSPNSDIFSKGEMLYLFNYAYREIQKRNFSVVVEGYTDALALHEENVCNTVAIMGRIFTKDQMKILARESKTVFLWPDGDGPGIGWARDSLPELFQMGCQVFIVDSPGLDPAQVAAREKMNLRDWMSKHTVPALNFFVERYARVYETEVSRMRTTALNNLLPMIDACRNRGDGADARALIANRFGVNI